jgi:hypothetical protein
VQFRGGIQEVTKGSSQLSVISVQDPAEGHGHGMGPLQLAALPRLYRSPLFDRLGLSGPAYFFERR